MSLEIGAEITVGDSSSEENYVRVYRAETVIPAGDADAPEAAHDLLQLCTAVLDRMLAEIQRTASDQMGQLQSMVGVES